MKGAKGWHGAMAEVKLTPLFLGFVSFLFVLPRHFVFGLVLFIFVSCLLRDFSLVSFVYYYFLNIYIYILCVVCLIS